jgi:uncharacterized protein (TIGR00255 family)
MIKSMTGFGKATIEIENKTVNIEIRSLNSKGADISVRIPSAFRNYEIELRNEMSKLLERGKIDLSIYVESAQTEAVTEINYELAAAYYKQLKRLAEQLGENLHDPIRTVISMPDVMKNEKKEADENEWKQIKKGISTAVAQLDEFRKQEGISLKRDFEERIGKIGLYLEEIKTLDANRVGQIKDRIRKNLDEAIGKDKYDENRLEQELIYYIEKLDINEEKVRLSAHLEHFMSTMNEASPGRKLNFIGQEIGREINTIGSKANDAQIQKFVVLMKDELEKIKEQTNNVL